MDTEPDADALREMLEDKARDWGANLVGVADTALLEGIPTDPPDLLQGYPRAVSMGVGLAHGVMDGVLNQEEPGPTPLYSRHYRRVNDLLDDAALRVSGLLQSHGGRALPIPASHILSEESFHAAVSHKAVALAAGLGWQGRSLLLVTPQFGPRVRLVTVLTDLDLPPDAPLKNRCGKCRACVEACPAQAVRGAGTDSHYESRNAALNLEACVARLHEHGRREHVDPYLCGVCVAACPWGRKKQKPRRRG